MVKREIAADPRRMIVRLKPPLDGLFGSPVLLNEGLLAEAARQKLPVS